MMNSLPPSLRFGKLVYDATKAQQQLGDKRFEVLSTQIDKLTRVKSLVQPKIQGEMTFDLSQQYSVTGSLEQQLGLDLQVDAMKKEENGDQLAAVQFSLGILKEDGQFAPAYRPVTILGRDLDYTSGAKAVKELLQQVAYQLQSTNRLVNVLMLDKKDEPLAKPFINLP